LPKDFSMVAVEGRAVISETTMREAVEAAKIVATGIIPRNREFLFAPKSAWTNRQHQRTAVVSTQAYAPARQHLNHVVETLFVGTCTFPAHGNSSNVCDSRRPQPALTQPDPTRSSVVRTGHVAGM
jgi:hypothetical protein